MKPLILAIILSTTAMAQRSEKFCTLALIGATTVDIATTRGHYEANPLLSSGGRLGARGISIKIGVTAGIWSLRFIPGVKRSKAYPSILCGTAGVYSLAAIHNQGLK